MIRLEWLERVAAAARAINTERLANRLDLTAIPFTMFEDLRDAFVTEPIPTPEPPPVAALLPTVGAEPCKTCGGTGGLLDALDEVTTCNSCGGTGREEQP